MLCRRKDGAMSPLTPSYMQIADRIEPPSVAAQTTRSKPRTQEGDNSMQIQPGMRGEHQEGGFPKRTFIIINVLGDQVEIQYDDDRSLNGTRSVRINDFLEGKQYRLGGGRQGT